MKKWIQQNRSLFVRLILIAFFLLLSVFIIAMKQSVSFSEWWARHVNRGFIMVLGALVSVIPFSLFEVIDIGLIIYGIVLLVLSIINFCHKRRKKGASKLVTILLIVMAYASLYIFVVEPVYNRASVPIELHSDKVEQSRYKEIVSYFLDDFNDCASHLQFDDEGDVIRPYSLKEMNAIAKEEFKRLDSDYYASFTYNAKSMTLLGLLYREFQITGVTSGLFAEANVNTYVTDAEIPFTLCHELSHLKGVMRENDANLVSAYICLTSSDYYFRYSGYVYTFSRELSLAHYTGTSTDYAELYAQLDDHIKAQYKYISRFWEKHDLLGKIGDWINDLYLKFSGTSGTNDYSDTTPTVTNGDITVYSVYQQLYFAIYFSAHD